MSRPTLRRLSAALILAAALWLAAPGAALAGPLEMTVPAVLESGLLGRLWQWLDHLWNGGGSAPSSEKNSTFTTQDPTGSTSSAEKNPNDPKGEQGGAIDPDG
jgi:hypothetical protein